MVHDSSLAGTCIRNVGHKRHEQMLFQLRRFFTFALLLSSFSCKVFAGSDTNGKKPIIWTKSIGLSYPLIASVSGGIIAPILGESEASKSPFGSVAVQASVDVGIGGGMISGGIFVQIDDKNPSSMKAICVKAALLRTWLLDIEERDRTYRGAIVELFSAAAGMGGKIGMGYFQTGATTQSSNDGLVYLYVGLGL